MPLQNVRVVDVVLRHPWRISRGVSTTRPNVFVELAWEGTIGYGMAAPNPRHGETAESVLATLQQLAPLVAGDPTAYRARADEVSAALPGHGAAKAAVDLALHDLAGKRLGAPLHRLLGIDPTRMPPTSYSIGIDEPAALAAKVAEAEPYAILKVKVGSEDDRALIQAVRAATTKPLRVDANEGWPSKEHAIAEIDWLAGQGVELVEQPLPAADEAGIRWLRERSPLPIVADEALATAADLPRLAALYHGVNVKLQKCGGLAEGLRAIACARALGLKVMLGCMIESALGIAAAAQLAPLVDWVDLDGHLLLADDPFRGHPIENGRIHLTNDPGLGALPGAEAAVGR